MMGFLWWRKNPRPKVLEPVKEPQKDIETLIEKYRLEKFLLNPVAQKYMGNIPESELKYLRRIEEQIIELLPDKFQRDIFTILARHGFDIVDFIEKDDWREDLQKSCRDISHFLYYGAPYPKEPEWEPLPFPGNEFFFWLLKQARSENISDRTAEIFKTFVEAETILDHSFDQEEKSWIFGRLIVIFAGEWAKQSAVLIDILNESKEGELFVRELLGLKK
ncbi:hypothetical protein MYX07_03135 [Patescibacteria group bacterium AH-259-L07]|nr:hypothetical protein [Patescibacteria group bacterium AH-259-L07]